MCDSKADGGKRCPDKKAYMAMPLSRIIPDGEELAWVAELKKNRGEDFFSGAKGKDLNLWGMGYDCEACFVLERLKKAKTEESEATPVLLEVADELGGKCESLDCRIKSPDSMFDKVTKKYVAGAPYRHEHSSSEFEENTKDVIRYTISFTSHKNLFNSLSSSIDSFKKRGWSIEKINDGYMEGATYKGLHVIVRSKQGTLIEVQIHSEHSLGIKNSTHDAYDVARNPSKPYPDREEAKKFCVEKYSSIPTPVGLNEIYPNGGVNKESVLFKGVKIVKKYYR